MLEQLTKELKNSGYSADQAKEIIVSGYRGWKRRLERRAKTGMYRPASQTLEEREKKKLIERETWYLPRKSQEEEQEGRKFRIGKRRLPKIKRKPDQKQEGEKESLIKAVMFAPCTVGSKLTKELKESENTLGQSTGAKLKVVERSGTKLMDILTSADPWRGKDCLRESCMLCRTKERTGKLLNQDCTRRSVVYETRCMTCYERSIKEKEERFQGDEEDEKGMRLRRLKSSNILVKLERADMREDTSTSLTCNS